MVLRRIKLSSKIKNQRGGAKNSGEDVNSISQFRPSSIPGLALWIKINPESIVRKTIQEYINEQSIAIQDDLQNNFKDRLTESVITEILATDRKNSLIRFDLDSAISLSFPEYIADPNGLDVISMKFDKASADGLAHPFKLANSQLIQLDTNYSMWSISTNVNYNYSPSLSKLVIEPNLKNYILQRNSNFSEIIVYSRELSPIEKEQLEGYVAYVKNEQYLLPFHSRYLPDMSYIPSLTPIYSSLEDRKTALSELLKNFNTILNKYRSTHSTDSRYTSEPIYRGRITDDFDDISIIQETFSKGALLSKKRRNDTLDAIYTSINELKISTVPFTPEYFANKIAELAQRFKELETYLDSFKQFDIVPDPVAVQIAEQQDAMNAVNTEEIFQETQLEIEASRFYQGLRVRSDEISMLGASLYEPLFKSFENKVLVYWNAVDYSNKHVINANNILLSSFKLVDQQIQSKEWLKYIPTIDISESDVKIRGGLPYSIQYRDSYLNAIQSTYEKVRNQLNEGDIAFIHKSVELKSAEIKTIYTASQNKLIQPVCSKTIIPHCKQIYEKINAYLAVFDPLVETLTQSIDMLNKALNSSKMYNTAPALEMIPVIPTDNAFLDDCNPVYMRKVNRSDASLTRIEYIVTDTEGNIIETTTPEGDIDITYIFPSFSKMDFSREDNMYFLYYPYKNDLGQPVKQELKILDPLPIMSIIDSIPEYRRPKYWFHKGTNLFEISREQENGIHQFVIEYAQYPIQLPKYAIKVGSYFLIQNVGYLPFQVQNPGYPDDTIDTIGSNESMLYIYSGPSDALGTNYYGRVVWRNGYVPWDTLLNCPRSAYSVFVKELNFSIYVRDTLEPICDTDGYFIKANTTAKGLTYDIDDVYHANPYSVNTLKEMHLSELIVDRGKCKMTIRSTDPQIWAIKDITTGLPVLCNSNGSPGINEYGYCKFVKTPMLLVDGVVKVRGAFGDITVSLAETLQIEQLGVLEPFLRFETVYRSKFVQPYTNNDKKTFIFLNLSKHPIISPKKKLIEPANWSLMPPHEVSYSDLSDNNKYAYIFNDSKSFEGLDPGTEIYPYISEKGALRQIEMVKASTIIVNRYITNKSYILDCLEYIKGAYKNIQALGQSAGEGALSVLQTENATIQKNLVDYKTYESSVQLVKDGLTKKVIDEQLKITIDMLDIKMRDIIQSVWKTFNTINETIEFFNQIVKDLKNVEDAAEKLRTTTMVEIEKQVGSVQLIYQNDAKDLKTTGAPEFDRLLKLAIKHKLDFIKNLSALELSIRQKPEDSTNFPNWIQQQQIQIKQLNDIAIKVRTIELTDVPRVFKARENIRRNLYLQKIKESVAQMDSYINYRDRMVAWLGLTDNPEYVEAAPIQVSGPPPVKGLSIDLVVFNELQNPSVERDWVGTTPESIQKIRMELLIPLEVLKANHKPALTGFQKDSRLSKVGSFDLMNTDGVRIILDDIRLKLQTMTNQLIAFETDLIPIFKAYESIRTDLRKDLKTDLLNTVQTIQTRWIAVTGKRTAIQTTIQAGGKTPEINADILAKLEEIFEIEPMILDILKGVTIPTYYDTMLYYSLKNEKQRHIDISKSLDTLEVNVQKESDRLVGSV
jgi:hypothetical protein